eukprot:s10453_g2.t1
MSASRLAPFVAVILFSPRPSWSRLRFGRCARLRSLRKRLRLRRRADSGHDSMTTFWRLFPRPPWHIMASRSLGVLALVLLTALAPAFVAQAGAGHRKGGWRC